LIFYKIQSISISGDLFINLMINSDSPVAGSGSLIS